MRKIAIANLGIANYGLRNSLAENFRGDFKFETTEACLNVLFWYPPSGLGMYTAERVIAFAAGYCSASNIKIG